MTITITISIDNTNTNIMIIIIITRLAAPAGWPGRRMPLARGRLLSI